MSRRRSGSGRGMPWRPHLVRFGLYGASGGASGSSQSPNWNELSQRPVGDSSDPIRLYVGGHRRVLPIEDAPVAVRLPQRPRHPRRGITPDRRRLGLRELVGGRLVLEDIGDDERDHPSAASCSRARSRSQSARKSSTSKRYAAEGAKAAMSPVQPSRSSRCGQSVGTSRKLPLVPHTTFRWNCLSSGSEHSNDPVRSCRCGRRLPPGQSTVSSPGHPETSAYRKPWNVLVGSNGPARH